MQKIDVLVLGGGKSTEREISLRSAAAVTKALEKAGFKAVFYDTKKGLGILNETSDTTIVFPILHGKGGEDGSLQVELEKRDILFLGSDSQASKNCFDKWLTREILIKHNLPVARGAYVTKTEYIDHPLSRSPHVLKLADGGSSIGTYIQRSSASLDTKIIEEAFKNNEKVVLESLIQGVEITVPIIDRKALPIIEIRPPENKEFDYENKYNGATEEICPPISIDKSIQSRAQSMAEKVHNVMGCRHLSRVDIMIDKNNDFFVLEINTIPGLTDQSLYPLSAKVAGIEMPDLMKRFVDLVKGE